MEEKKIPEGFLIPLDYITICEQKHYENEEEKEHFKKALWRINEYIHELKEADIPIQNKILTWA